MLEKLPRREREIFEILCSLGEASAVDVRQAMSEAPSHSAVRTLLGRLEAKGLIKHHERDQAYIYKCVRSPANVRDSVLRRVVNTFFDGSGIGAATALVGLTKGATDQELDVLQQAIDAAKTRRS